MLLAAITWGKTWFESNISMLTYCETFSFYPIYLNVSFSLSSSFITELNWKVWKNFGQVAPNKTFGDIDCPFVDEL